MFVLKESIVALFYIETFNVALSMNEVLSVGLAPMEPPKFNTIPHLKFKSYCQDIGGCTKCKFYKPAPEGDWRICSFQTIMKRILNRFERKTS